MPRNGSGTFNRIYDWTTDQANGINCEADRMDEEFDGIATALSNSIAKDGQTTITANIPFNSKKITGLANGSARTDSIALGQVQDNSYGTLGTLGGSADTYTASPSPAITAYATGSEFNLKVNADNTGASTLNISAVGAKNIKKYNGAGSKIDLGAGDLQQDQYYKVIYDGTDFILDNPEIIDNLKSNNLKSNNLTINNKLNTQQNAATIINGEIPYTGGNMVIDTEGGAASDNLDTINGGSVGDILFLREANNARQITIKHITGNIALHPSNDVAFSDTQDYIALQYDGANWVNFGRSFERDFSSSKAINGYTYLPNGLILQWGSTNNIEPSSGDAFCSATFPITFPNYTLGATSVGNFGSYVSHNLYAFNASSITFRVNEWSGVTNVGKVWYMVIGA